jgi:glycine/D-amino acid oxidase-like deaminating enzyme
MFDAIVIGGGFYGCCLAIYLRHRGLKKVLLVEREALLLNRASYVNQARLHNGYHYPRSFRTAARSRTNLSRFIRDFPDCVVADFQMIYCIGRRDSKVGHRHFEQFCKVIGAPLRPASSGIRKLFSERLIEAVYETEEYAFNYEILRDMLWHQLIALDVEVRVSTPLRAVQPIDSETLLVELDNGQQYTTSWVFNCTYAGLNYVAGARRLTSSRLKHEITEIALVAPPDELTDIGITVMCGPFFSVMPFPARNLYSFSHVTYTPHVSWIDQRQAEQNPYTVLDNYSKQSKFPYMLRDAMRYLPILQKTRYVESIFEIKTLLLDSEIDDSRPILFDQHPDCPHIVSIMGGKIDNIYDIYEFLDRKLKL